MPTQDNADPDQTAPDYSLYAVLTSQDSYNLQVTKDLGQFPIQSAQILTACG